jgi:uncharacterized DUF497 family protein
VKLYVWDLEKNTKLIKERNISFEKILQAIEDGALIDVVDHPNIKKYPRQRCLIVNYEGYCYMVPFIENEKERVLKTVIPSRKLTKFYLQGASDDL